MAQHRLVAGCAVAVLLVVLAAAAEGLTTPSGRWSSLPGAPLPTPTPTRPPTELEVAAPAPGLDLSGLVLPALVVVALAVLAVVGLVLLRLWQRRTSRRERLQPLEEAAVAGGLADAPVVRRGIARSLEALDGPRDLGDAVVGAWLALEESAEDAGLARGPAETPTEFTTRLLERVPADRDAVDVLRTLYARARFGTGARNGDVERARAALRDLAASWDAAVAAPVRDDAGRDPA